MAAVSAVPMSLPRYTLCSRVGDEALTTPAALAVCMSQETASSLLLCARIYASSNANLILHIRQALATIIVSIIA
jgi:hypothetical protein